MDTINDGIATLVIGDGCFLYLALFAVSNPAIETFAIITITVPFAAFTGLLLGIWAIRNKSPCWRLPSYP